MAPDRRGPTEGNGTDVPRGTLHVALVIPHRRWFEHLKDTVHIVQPPYWGGEVALHMIPSADTPMNSVDWQIRQALIDSGLADPDQVEFATPREITLGWPTD